MSHAPELIETVRLRGGEAPLWGFHLARVIGSCTEVGVPPPRELLLAAGGPDRVVRFVVSARGVETSERPVGSSTPVRLIVSTERHEPYPHKLTARDVFDRALREAESQGADDGVLLTHGGWVAETSIWGLYSVGRPSAARRPPISVSSAAWRAVGSASSPRSWRCAPRQPISRAPLSSWPTRRAGWSPWRRWGENPVVTDPANRGAGRGFLGLTAPPTGPVSCAARCGNVVVVAQLVRAPVCGTGGCGFNPRQPPCCRSAVVRA